MDPPEVYGLSSAIDPPVASSSARSSAPTDDVPPFDLEIEFPVFAGIGPDPAGVLLLPYGHKHANDLVVSVYHRSNGEYLPIQWKLAGARYGVARRGPFLEWVAAHPGEGCYFELYYGNQPLALFFDVDCPDPDVTEEQYYEMLTCFVDVLRSFLPEALVWILSSHGPGKWSTHVHVDPTTYYAENNQATADVLKNVINGSARLLEYTARFPKLFDPSIYKNTGSMARAFRFAGCCKEPGGTRVLMPDAYYAMGTLCASDVEKCLLNVRHVDLSLSRMFEAPAVPSPKRKKSTSERRPRPPPPPPPAGEASPDTDPGDFYRDPAQLAILDENVALLMEGRGFHLARTNSEGPSVIYSTLSRECPLHDRTHHQNKIFLICEFSCIRFGCHNSGPYVCPDKERHPTNILAACASLVTGTDLVLHYEGVPRFSTVLPPTNDISLIRPYDGALAWMSHWSPNAPRPLTLVYKDDDNIGRYVRAMVQSLFPHNSIAMLHETKRFYCCAFRFGPLVLFLFPNLVCPTYLFEESTRRFLRVLDAFVSGTPLIPVGTPQSCELERDLMHSRTNCPNLLVYSLSIAPHMPATGESMLTLPRARMFAKSITASSPLVEDSTDLVTVDMSNLSVYWGDRPVTEMEREIVDLVRKGRGVSKACANFYFARVVQEAGRGWLLKTWNSQEQRMVLVPVSRDALLTSYDCGFAKPVAVWRIVREMPHPIYSGVVYYPYPFADYEDRQPASVPNFINIFAPFPAWLRVKDFEPPYLYLPHLLRYFEEVYCNGVAQVAEVLWAMLARLLRTPNDLFHKIFVIHGGQGLGKSTFFEFFGALLLGHGRHQISRRNLSGSQFNGLLKETSMEILDDGVCDKEWGDAMKHMSTARVRHVEAKFVDVKTVHHPTLYGALTNTLPTLDVSIDDRRFVFASCYPLKKDDPNHKCLVDSFYTVLHNTDGHVAQALATELSYYLLRDFPLDKIAMPDILPTHLRHTLINNSFSHAERLFRRCVANHMFSPSPRSNPGNKDDTVLHIPYNDDQHWPEWICVEGVRQVFAYLSGGKGDVRHSGDTIQEVVLKYGGEVGTPRSSVVPPGMLGLIWFKLPTHSVVLEKAKGFFPLTWTEESRVFYPDLMPAKKWLKAYPVAGRVKMNNYAVGDLDRASYTFLPPAS